jgi:serine/threonine protein kinase
MNPGDGFSPRLEERRKANVFVNGTYSADGGRTLYVPEEMSMAQLLNAAGRRLNMNAQRVFNSDGHEVDDLILIDPDDVLFFSGGEDFIVPQSTNKDITTYTTSSERNNSMSQTPVKTPMNDETDKHNTHGDSEYSKSGMYETNESIDNNNDNNDNDENDNQDQHQIVTVGGYEIRDLLGQGAFGEVYRGVHQVTRDVVALKFLTKRSMRSALDAQKVFVEIHCLETLQHNHVIKLLGVKNADTHMVLIFEYAGGGDLKQYLEWRKSSSHGSVTEEEASDIFRAIVDGVSYCHKKNIVHRDLKLDNILLTVSMKDLDQHEETSVASTTGAVRSSHAQGTENTCVDGNGNGNDNDNESILQETAKKTTTSISTTSRRSSSRSASPSPSASPKISPHSSPRASPRDSPYASPLLRVVPLPNRQLIANGIKIADFGLSAIYRPGNASTSKAGSLAYMAPEVLGDQEFLGPPCDVWSLGVILFALVCGRLPFDGTSYNDVKQKVKEGKYTFSDLERTSLSHEVKDLLSKILRKNPSDRLDVGRMISHPWMEKYARYTVRRVSGMNFPIARQSSTSSTSSTTSSLSLSSATVTTTTTTTTSTKRFAPSPPLEPKSPPSKGRMIMQQLSELSDSTMGTGSGSGDGSKTMKKSASMPAMHQGGRVAGIRSPSPKNTSSRSSSRSNSPSAQQSQKRLIRTMQENNDARERASSPSTLGTSLSRFGSGFGGGGGIPPRPSSRPPPRTGWGTPTRQQSFSSLSSSSSSSSPSSHANAAVSPLASPSPQSSPIPLSVFGQRYTVTTTNASPANGASSLFIHEGQTASFQRITVTSSTELHEVTVD